MPQPLTNPDIRRQNLALAFGTLLRSGQTTRKQLEHDTGLSKATVSRLVDELIELGFAASSPLGNAQGRGRRPDTIAIPAQLGQVVGISFGLRRTVVLGTDLACREAHQQTLPTPQWRSGDEAIAWLVQRVDEARQQRAAPLHQVAIAVPARVIDGAVLHPQLSMSVLEHRAFAAELSDAVGAEVVVDSDANMALSAVIAEGIVGAGETPLLLNMGTVLTAARRRSDGELARGRSDAFGNFALLPFHSTLVDSTLGGMLSTSGLEQFCTRLGYPLEPLAQLWEQPTAETAPIRQAFADALLMMLRIACITVDPPLVLLAGRLVPLVDLVLPQVLARLRTEITEPPTVRSLPLFGTTHSPAHGAAHIALARAHTGLCGQLLL